MIARFSCLIGCVLFFISAPTCRAQRQKKEPFDVIHGRYEVWLSDSSHRIQGRASLTVAYPDSVPDQTILDLTQATASGKGMKVDALLYNGHPVSYVHRSDQLIIATPSEMSVGDTAVLYISYSGIPKQGLKIAPNEFGDRTFFSAHWPNLAHGWLPVVDHPQERATCEFVITAPAKYQVVSNGTLQERILVDQGMARTSWKMDRPIPAKVMAVGVAEFMTRTFDEAGRSTAWVYKKSGNQALEDFEAGPAILSMLTELLGPYPFSKCDHIESTTKFGGMENATAIFYSERQVSGRYDLKPTIAHEIAHQWFGNALSEDSWKDVWLSEGFATFFEYYFVGEYYGNDALRLLLYEEEAQIRKFNKRHPEATIVPAEIGPMDDLLNALVYNKAGRMLLTLYQDLGKDTFGQVIRTFYDRYQFKSVSTQDFIDVSIEISGKDLEVFFLQWLYQPGLPVEPYSWD